jgi:hypothetical protein
LKIVMKKSFLYLSGLINQIEPGSIWFNGFSSPKWNMWNETRTFRSKFIWKIRNGPRFEMRWKLFCFVSFFELVWNISAIPDKTKRNWQPSQIWKLDSFIYIFFNLFYWHFKFFFLSYSIIFLILIWFYKILFNF